MNVELQVDTGLYPVESILGTAYVFIDRCYVFLDRLPDGKVRVSLTAKPGTASPLGDVAGDFQNELLAQALRLRIAARHEKVREAIVARALFGAAPELPRAAPDDAQLGIEPQHLPSEGDDFLDDPLGIAVPWEEKYGNAPADGASASTAAHAVPPPDPGRDR